MKAKTIRVLVIAFIVLHFSLGMLCFYGDIFSANWVMTHVYEDYYDHPKNLLRVTWEILRFPAGPLSSLFWAIPFYVALKLVPLRIRRGNS